MLDKTYLRIDVKKGLIRDLLSSEFVYYNI